MICITQGSREHSTLASRPLRRRTRFQLNPAYLHPYLTQFSPLACFSCIEPIQFWVREGCKYMLDWARILSFTAKACLPVIHRTSQTLLQAWPFPTTGVGWREADRRRTRTDGRIAALLSPLSFLPSSLLSGGLCHFSALRGPIKRERGGSDRWLQGDTCGWVRT